MSVNYAYYPYYLSFDEIPVPNFCTTRHGGVSIWPYHSSNLSFNTEDNPENIRKNRIIISERLGIPVDKFIYLNQIHTDKIYYAKIFHCGKALEMPCIDGDGLFTDEKGICLVVMLADCVGVFVYDPEKNVIGICHSGWRGCLLNVCGKLVENIVENFGSDKGNLIAGISPSICKNCYTVGCDIVQKFPDSYSPYVFQNKNMWHIDLKGIITRQLNEKGIRNENILNLDICTYENTHIFYSYRAEKDTGRFIFGIYLPE